MGPVSSPEPSLWAIIFFTKKDNPVIHEQRGAIFRD